MKLSKTAKFMTAVAVVTGVVGLANAAIYVEEFGAVPNGWSVNDNPLGLAGAGEGTISGTAGTLEITANTDGLPPTIDYIGVASGSSLLAEGGDFVTRGVQALSFDFYVNPANQGAGNDYSVGAIYFRGGLPGSEHVWTWAFADTGGVGGTRTIRANIETDTLDTAFGGSWISADGGTFSDWATDLNTIAEIGVVVGYAEGPNQIVSFDNFTLGAQAFYVPEPETYAALAAAFLGMAFVFRKRLREGLATIPAFAQVA